MNQHPVSKMKNKNSGVPKRLLISRCHFSLITIVKNKLKSESRKAFTISFPTQQKCC